MLTVLGAKLIGALVALVFLGLLVFFHELGHFLFARFTGMSVSSFGVGFGPALWRRTIRGVEYRLGVIFCGGFVNIIGMSVEKGRKEIQKLRESGRPAHEVDELAREETWFCNKGPLAKILVSFGGPLFSFLLAFPLIIAALAIEGKVVDPSAPAQIAQVQKDSPAEKADLLPGDVVVAVNGQPAPNLIELQLAVIKAKDEKLTFTIDRGGSTHNVELTPDRSTTVPSLGATFKRPTRSLDGLGEAVTVGSGETIRYTDWQIRTMKDFFTGQLPVEVLAGPVGIVKLGIETSKGGVGKIFLFFGLITMALAFSNLVPIPHLDGGHILFATIEGLFGEMNASVKKYLHWAGATLIISFVVVVTANDFGILKKALALFGM